MYEALANVASQVFGGGDNTDNPKAGLSQVKVPDKNVIKSSHEAIKLFSDIFGRG